MPSEPYRTLDGSLVTELVRPEGESSRNLSVAEAVLMPGQSTIAHYHSLSEEVYYVLEGSGVLYLNSVPHELSVGQAHLIHPGEEHKLTCAGTGPLRILCLCAPPYQHEDTTLTEPVVA